MTWKRSRRGRPGAGPLPRPTSDRNWFRARKRSSSMIKRWLRAAQIPGIVSLAQGIPLRHAGADRPLRPGKDRQRRLQPLLAHRDCRSCARPSRRPPCAKGCATIENEIVVTCGSIEAISATLLALLQPGDGARALPSYPSYVEAIRMAGGSPRFVPLVEKRTSRRPRRSRARGHATNRGGALLQPQQSDGHRLFRFAARAAGRGRRAPT